MPEAQAPIELWHRSEGEGTPVVLLHGLGGDHTVYGSLVAPLARHHRSVVVDLRGHGRSPAPAGASYTFEAMEADLRAMLDRDALGPVHLVGLSAGGFLALRLAFDAPERLRSLVLIGSAAHCDAHTRAMGDRWAETYRDGGPDAYALRLLKDLFYPDWIEAHLDVADRIREQPKSFDPHAIVAWGAETRTFDVRGRIGRLRLPTLVVHGMDDQVVDPSHARLLRQSIPGAEMKLFAQTGHLVPLERPTELAAALDAFYAKVDAGRPSA